MSYKIEKEIVVGVRAIIIQEDKVLLVQQTNKAGRIIHLLPGGGVHNNENLNSAVIREVKEETGLDVRPIDIRYIREMLSFSKITYEFIFSADIIGGRLKLGHDPEQVGLGSKLKGVLFYPLSELDRVEFYPTKLKSQLLNDYQSNWRNSKVLLEKEVFD